MKPFLFSLFIFACAGHVSALTVSLADVPGRVRSNHPALKAARLAIEEAKGRQLGAGRLANPSLGFEFQKESDVSPQASVFSVDQSFPITRRLSLEKRLSAQLVEAAALEVKDAERRFVAEAQQAVVRLLTLDRQRALRQQQMGLAQKLSDFAGGRAKAGEVSPLDAKQAKLDAQRLAVEGRLLEAQSVTALGRLKPLLGLRSNDTLTITGDLPEMVIPTSTSWEKRPDYRLAEAKTAAAGTDRELAIAKRLPDITAGLFAAREAQDVGSNQRERTGSIGIRLSIPLPFWNRNQGEIAEKKAAEERSRLETAALAIQINGEVGTARKEMETNAAIVRETRDSLLPLAVEQTDSMHKAYETGQADLQAVLRASDQRLQLEASSLDALRDFHLARIEYEAAIAKHAPAASSKP